MMDAKKGTTKKDSGQAGMTGKKDLYMESFIFVNNFHLPIFKKEGMKFGHELH